MPNRAFAASIPDHLKPYIVEQDASLYTPIDHAAWRYILRVSRAFFSKTAHQKYLDGLRETGISTERIPLISEMDACLKKFGWRAVAVSGFIPPAAFMEFQSLGILPIACDMRTIEHLAYTPAPDIVHEAAGHAPIIADPEYAEYLREYGEVSRKALFSAKDVALYEAIRNLSEVKENPNSTSSEIEAAQIRLAETVSSIDYVSEASYLSRMYWWTVEYGLVGDPANPKIYGAGLLSSVGESYACLHDSVQKIPFTLDCMNRSYDITRPQPQLFVSSDFQSLTRKLRDFAETMAYRLGGLEGVTKAIAGAALSTTVLETGIQISGVVESVSIDSSGSPSFLKFKGPTQLSYRNVEIDGHSVSTHSHGFSCPIGRLSSGIDLSTLDRVGFEKLGFKDNTKAQLRFESEIVLEGVLKQLVRRDEKTLIASFSDCTIRNGDLVLYRPDWGVFDLAIGAQIVSVFGGASDFKAYFSRVEPPKKTKPVQKTNLTEENSALNEIYREIRDHREGGKKSLEALLRLYGKLGAYPDDWLSRLELLEMVHSTANSGDFSANLKNDLDQLSRSHPSTGELISRGLALLEL